MKRSIAGIFDSMASAQRARAALERHGLAAARMTLSRSLVEDGIAGEASAQSCENQPGQRPDPSKARFNESVRSGGCVLFVAAGPGLAPQVVRDVLRECGARQVTTRG